MNKKIFLVVTLFATLNAGTQDKIEVYNILSSGLKKNMIKQVPIEKKYDFDFVKKRVKSSLTKIQNIELFRMIKLYNLNEFKASKVMLHNMIKPLNNKYTKLFDILFSIEIKLENKEPIENELEAILNFGEYDLFFIKKTILILNKYSLYKEGIFLLQNIDKIENDFVKTVDIRYCNEKIIKEDFEYYKGIKFPLKDTKNSLAYFYEQDNKLLEAYEVYITNNIDKKNNIRISALREQIKFRIKKYHTEQYDTNVKDIKKEIENTRDFLIYKIFTEKK